MSFSHRFYPDFDYYVTRIDNANEVLVTKKIDNHKKDLEAVMITPTLVSADFNGKKLMPPKGTVKNFYVFGEFGS